MTEKMYVCDPSKGQECSSVATCRKNGGTCYITTKREFAAEPVSEVRVGSAYDKLVTQLLQGHPIESVQHAQKPEAEYVEINKRRSGTNVLASLGILGVVE